MKRVCQLDHAGYYLGPVAADPSPAEPGVWLLPGRCVDQPPPLVPDGQRARWDGESFILEVVPTPAVPEPPSLLTRDQ